MTAPTLVIFAGPNGSGKSTLKRAVAGATDLGTYINADEIASELFEVAREQKPDARRQEYEYEAFVEAGRRRDVCIEAFANFSFETVFSHISKVDFIRRAKIKGFTVVLYFVSTENSALNLARVKKRVSEGGHTVPDDKVIARYRRAMEYLVPASMEVDEVSLFDNSGSTMRLVAQLLWPVQEPPNFKFYEPIPQWIQAWANEIMPIIREAAIRRQQPLRLIKNKP
jgi:predicted ABC-type ATPase